VIARIEVRAAAMSGVSEELVILIPSRLKKFPDTGLKFPDLLNIFPVNFRR
jgi:hypothetical protein